MATRNRIQLTSRILFRLPQKKVSEANHNSRRQPNIILRRSKKTRLYVVSLESPRDRTNDFVVESAAKGRRKRSIGAETVRIHVAASEQRLCEGPEFPYRERHTRPEEEVLLVGDYVRTANLPRPRTRRLYGYRAAKRYHSVR